MDSEFEILDGVTPLTIDDLVFSSNYARSMRMIIDQAKSKDEDLNDS